MPLKQIKISEVACGNFHTLAIEKDSAILWAWGSQAGHHTGSFNKGQCGYVKSSQNPGDGFSVPRKMAFFQENRSEIGRVDKIAAGGFHSLASCIKVDANGVKQSRLFSWGAGNFGQLGIGKLRDVTKPIEALLTLNNDYVSKVAAGGQHSVVLTKRGSIYSFGYGAYGQLGLNKSDFEMKP